MQIHELNPFWGTPSASDYLAIDDGTNTLRVPATALGVSIQMTIAEAESGTSTASRVVSPKVLHDYVLERVAYGTSSSSATTTAKTATCSGFKLAVGAVIAVKFTYATTTTSTCTLNVNSTGATTISGTTRGNGSATNIAGAWEAGETKFFVYDGTYWRLVDMNIITASELTTLESTLGL